MICQLLLTELPPELVVYEDLSCWSELPSVQNTKFENLILLSSGEKTSLFLQDAEIGSYVGCCVPEAAIGKANGVGWKGIGRGLKKMCVCVCDGEKEREKGGAKRERSSLWVGITNLFNVIQIHLFAVAY